MELKDTCYFMMDENYIARFKAEYWQTKIRYNKLHKLIVKYDAGTLPFKPDCPIELLKDQKKHMGLYLYDLEVRAEIEGICLDFPAEECNDE